MSFQVSPLNYEVNVDDDLKAEIAAFRKERRGKK
jgi:hypothetical protein